MGNVVTSGTAVIGQRVRPVPEEVWGYLGVGRITSLSAGFRGRPFATCRFRDIREMSFFLDDLECAHG